MHYPVELTLGPARLPVHLLCEVLAYTLGYRLYTYLRARRPDPISSAHRQWIFVGAAAGALLGSRALGLLEHPDLLANPPGGCRFHPRCPMAVPACSTTDPALAPHDGRDVACIRLGETAAAAG